MPKSKGGSRTVVVSARLHACHHAITSNHMVAEALACYTFAAHEGLGWGGHFAYKMSGDYAFIVPLFDMGMLRSRPLIVSLSAQMLIGNMSPRQLTRALQQTWLSQASIRYMR